VWESQAAGVAGIATAIIANYLAQRFGIRTRRATDRLAMLLTRKESVEDLDE
jgi:2-phosphoglycerate kinase